MRILIMTIVLSVGVGCGEESSGTCSAPNDNVSWVFYTEQSVLGVHEKCIYCGNSVREADLYDYVKTHYESYVTNGNEEQNGEMLLTELEERKAEAEEEGGDIKDRLTPCFYTYQWGAFDTDTIEGCAQDVCSDAPSINDNVGRAHGAWRVSSSYINLE